MVTEAQTGGWDRSNEAPSWYFHRNLFFLFLAPRQSAASSKLNPRSNNINAKSLPKSYQYPHMVRVASGGSDGSWKCLAGSLGYGNMKRQKTRCVLPTVSVFLCSVFSNAVITRNEVKHNG